MYEGRTPRIRGGNTLIVVLQARDVNAVRFEITGDALEVGNWPRHPRATCAGR